MSEPYVNILNLTKEEKEMLFNGKEIMNSLFKPLEKNNIHTGSGFVLKEIIIQNATTQQFFKLGAVEYLENYITFTEVYEVVQNELFHNEELGTIKYYTAKESN